MGEMMRLWGNVEPDTERRIKRVIEYQKSTYQAEQRFAELWPGSTWDWSKLPWVASSPEALSRLSEERGRIRKPVSTTFRGLGRNRTLCLIVHGYLMTRESLMAAFPRYQPPPIPDKMLFQELLP